MNTTRSRAFPFIIDNIMKISLNTIWQSTSILMAALLWNHSLLMILPLSLWDQPYPCPIALFITHFLSSIRFRSLPLSQSTHLISAFLPPIITSQSQSFIQIEALLNIAWSLHHWGISLRHALPSAKNSLLNVFRTSSPVNHSWRRWSSPHSWWYVWCPSLLINYIHGIEYDLLS